MARQAWLAIDMTGKSSPYYTAVSQYGAQAQLLQNLLGATVYKIWDAHYDEYASSMVQECCCTPLPSSEESGEIGHATTSEAQ